LGTIIIGHIASGQAFFSGGVLVLLAIGLRLRIGGRGRKTLSTLLAWVGLLLAVASATPLPLAFWALTLILTVTWLLAESWNRAPLPRLRPWLRGLLALIWCVGMAWEAPYHVMPSIPKVSEARLDVIGDSVSAGLGNESETWPRRFARVHGVEVRDHSRAGATVRLAWDQARAIAQGRGMGLVLVEIGGNDLLGSTPPAEFERDLNALLVEVKRRGVAVVMMELPLPPFHQAYGAIQRKLATRHGVRLIPKRVLLEVLIGPGNTTDSIHLAPLGHRRMEEALWEAIGPAFRLHAAR